MFMFYADNVSGKIREDYFTEVLHKNLSFYDTTKTGEIGKFWWVWFYGV